MDSGLSYAIIRPTVIFGPEDILINNIAWLLRRFPVFAIPGSGSYPLQPIFVEDLAEIAVTAAGRTENLALDAVGPEIYPFTDLVDLIASAVGSRAWRLHANPNLALAAARSIGWVLGDVVLTKDEVDGLMAGLLVSTAPPTGRTSLRQWLQKHAPAIGAGYASELKRHYH